MSALGRFERFTPFFTSRLTFQTLAVSLFFGVGVLGFGWLLLCCVFVSCFASVWNPEFSAHLDLDDGQGLIASSAMQ